MEPQRPPNTNTADDAAPNPFTPPDPSAASTERPKPSLGPVLLTVLLDLLGFGLVIPLLSFYAETFGASAREVTALMASYSVAQFLFAPMWGALSDRVGRRPVMLASVAGSAIFLALFASADQLWMLFVLRFLHGACAANIGTAQAVVADLTTPENRARGMGLIGASFGLGFTLGPALGGVLAEYGMATPIWVAAALSAINFVWAWLRLPESRHAGSGSASSRTYNLEVIFRTLSHPTVGMVIGLTFVATFAFSMLEATFSLTAEHVWSMGPRDVGMLFGMIGIIGIVIQGGLTGRLTRRFGESLLLNIGYLCTASGMLLLAIASRQHMDLAFTLFACALVAVGTSLANPSLSSLISRASSRDQQGSTLGVNQSLAALARATAPAVGGELYSSWYEGGAFAVGAIMMTAAMLLSIPAARRAVSEGGTPEAEPEPR